MQNLTTWFQSKRPVRFWFPLLFGSLLLIMGLIVSLLLVSKPQDVRQDASTGNVELFFVQDTTPLRANRTSKLFLRLNTKGETIDGIQVVMDVKGNDLEEIGLRFLDLPDLRRVWEKTEDISGGKRFSFAYITTDPTKGFSSNSNQEVAEITFRAKGETNASVTFDPSWTKVNKRGDGSNVLKPVTTVAYAVEKALPTPTPTATPKATPAVGGPGKGATASPSPKAPVATLTITESTPSTTVTTPTPSPIVSPSPRISPKVSPSVTPFASPTTEGNEVVEEQPSLLSRVLTWLLYAVLAIAVVAALLYAFSKYQDRTGTSAGPMSY